MSSSVAQVIFPFCPIFFARAAAMVPPGLPAATSWGGYFEYVCNHKFAHHITQNPHNFEPSTLCSFFFCCLFSKVFASYQPFVNATPRIVSFCTLAQMKIKSLPN